MWRVFEKVLITNDCIEKLVKFWVTEQYKKAKEYILKWLLQNVNFKKREPYKSEKYYFRINKQYRAICYIENNCLKVFEIDNHQN